MKPETRVSGLKRLSDEIFRWIMMSDGIFRWTRNLYKKNFSPSLQRSGQLLPEFWRVPVGFPSEFQWNRRIPSKVPTKYPSVGTSIVPFCFFRPSIAMSTNPSNDLFFSTFSVGKNRFFNSGRCIPIHLWYPQFSQATAFRMPLLWSYSHPTKSHN